MRLVIDGYNFIHATPELAQAEAGGQGREALLALLAQYKKARPHRVSVVFDGVDPSPGPGGKKGIPVVFSGPGRSADDVIADMARRQGTGLTVITDDQELAGRCRRRGAEVLGCAQFGQRLLMATLGAEALPEEEEPGWDFTTRKKGPSRREPKARRRKNRRLGRL